MTTKSNKGRNCLIGLLVGPSKCCIWELRRKTFARGLPRAASITQHPDQSVHGELKSPIIRRWANVLSPFRVMSTVTRSLLGDKLQDDGLQTTPGRSFPDLERERNNRGPSGVANEGACAAVGRLGEFT